jgi:hypothetical protein
VLTHFQSVCKHKDGVCHIKFANLKAANAAMAFDGKILNESAVQRKSILS